MALNTEQHTEQRQLSISNPHRKVLNGPRFLDYMVSSRPTDAASIEYSDSHRARCTVTYKELHQQASILAHTIRTQLATTQLRNQVVPVIIPQHPALYISYLAVLKCGAAFCPIAPDTPWERLMFIVKDVDAKLILCLPDWAESMDKSFGNIPILPVELKNAASNHFSHYDFEDCGRQCSDAAYVMYTSGSTGKPKGVPITHEVVCQSLLAHDEHIPRYGRFLQFAAPTFDVSLFEIFFTWFRGSTLVCCERDTLLADLVGQINYLEIDAAELTPTVATTLLRTRDAVPGLKILLTIGEMLTSHVVKTFGGNDREKSILYAMYGPTEAAIHCTIEPQMSCHASIHDIGHPFSTVTSFILSETGEHAEAHILPLGQTGELALAGQLSPGYLNRYEQTMQAFNELPGYGRVYRTGDRARMKPDGSLQILGRIATGQVKLRGQRVELGEVEAAAAQTQGVEMAIALVIENALVVFCTGRTSLQKSEIFSGCNAWLPRHMRPTDILLLRDGMPRLPSGKVDRNKLAELYRRVGAQSETEQQSVLSSLELQILDSISSELGRRLTAQQSLRAAGVDSLRAIRIASRLRNKFAAVNMTMLLEADSVSHLARILNTSTSENVSNNHADHFGTPWSSITHLNSEIIAKVHAEMDGDQIEDIWPCTPIQVGMLTESIYDERQNFNEISLELDSSVSFSAFQIAFQRVAEVNAIMRAAFVMSGDVEMPFLHVIRRKPAFKAVVDLQNPLRLVYRPSTHRVDIEIHHAIYDGWSWDIIMHDLNAVLSGQSLAHRPCFKEVVRIKNEGIRENDPSDLMSWASILQRDQITMLPVLRPELDLENEMCQYSATLSTTYEELTALADNAMISKPAIMHTALNLLLAELCDSRKIISGLVIAGREAAMPGIEEVIGPCLSTLPVVVDMETSKSLGHVMADTYQAHMHCLRHSNMPLAHINSAINLAPDTPLFDVIFVWQESLYSNRKGQLARVVDVRDRLKYALVVEVEPVGSFLTMKFTYNTSKIAAEHAGVVHHQVDFIMKMLVIKPDSLVMDLWHDLPSEIASISPVKSQLVSDDSLISTIELMASSHPHKIAVEFINDFDPLSRKMNTQRLSYGDLHGRANATAHRLRTTYELAPNDIVLIWSNKSIELYVLICATAMAGVAYLCVDPTTPKHRLQAILTEANPRLLVVQASMDFPDDTLVNVALISTVVSDEPESVRPLSAKASGTDLAYCVFTSGSTGKPKGVLITRSNMFSNVQHLASIYPYSSSSRLLQSCSTAFDVSVFEIFWTWHCGLTLCSATNDVLFRDIEGLINACDVTHLSMTPSVAALVNPAAVPNVDFLVCAGEPMSVKVFDAWVNRGLHQGYGPSETVNICNVRSPQTRRSHINNVGPAFPNTSIFVSRKSSGTRQSDMLNVGDLRVLPLGAIGEIWIGGAQVGRGYTDAKLTAQHWLDHPRYGRLYKSGDIGKLLADGSLLVVGREDGQAKIRGQRIELNEVNLQLIQMQEVSDAFTMILTDSKSKDHLVTFWVSASSEPEARCENLYEHLRDRLPSYMIPEFLIAIPFIPLTAQGKVDRRTLEQDFRTTNPEKLMHCSDSCSVNGTESCAMNESELKVAQAIAEVSGTPLEQLNVHASFFTYGIDSIKAIALAKEIRSAGFASAEISTVMRFPSIRRLVRHLDRHKAGSGSHQPTAPASSAVPATIREPIESEFQARGFVVETVLPCTPLQEAMLASTSSCETSYFNHLVYKMIGDFQRMRYAWALMIERHAVLRTIFAPTNDTTYPYVQVVLKHHQLRWSVFEHPDLNCTISPYECPPYSLQVISTRDGTKELHLFIHHALYDAQALEILQEEVETAYHGMKLSDPVPFTRYLDYVVSHSGAEQDIFWERLLRGVQPSRLQDRLYTSEHKEPDVSVAKQTIPREPLRRCARNMSTTTLAILQCSLARLLSTYLQSTDVCFGTVYSGRNVNVHGIDRIVGPCFNTLPTRAYVPQAATNSAVCQKMHEVNMRCLEYQASSVRRMRQGYSSDGKALFDVLLLLQTSSPKPDTGLWDLIHDAGQMDFPFIFEIVPISDNDELDILLHTTSCNDTSFKGALLRNFAAFVTDTVENPLALAVRQLGVISPFRATHMNGHATSQAISSRTNSYSTHPTNSHVESIVRDAISSYCNRTLFRIDDTTTIFQAGLDSISAVQLAARLRSTGYMVSASEILEEPRICRIVDLCEKRRKHPPPATKEPSFNLRDFDKQHRSEALRFLKLPSRAVAEVYPCTTTQSGMLSEFLQSGGHLYYNKIRFRLNHIVNPEQLENALNRVVERHAMLRTGFVPVKHPQIPFAMVLYQTEYLEKQGFIRSSSYRTRKLKDVAGIAMPMWHLRISEDAIRTIELEILHALYDAQSLNQILTDLINVYCGKPMVSPTSISGTLSSIVSQNLSALSDEQYWHSLRHVARPTLFPELNMHTEVLPKLHTSKLSLQSNLTDIRNACADRGWSLSVAFQLAWAKLLAVYTGERGIVFGSVFSGRSFEDTELNDAVFPCINTLPIIVEVTTDLQSMARHIQKLNAAIHKQPHMSISHAKKALGIEGRLFDTMLVIQNPHRDKRQKQLWEIVAEDASAEYTVSLEVTSSDSTVELCLVYEQKRVPLEHGPILLSQFEDLLYEVLELDHQLHEQARNKSHKSPDEALISSKNECLHDLVLATATSQPDKAALELVTVDSHNHLVTTTWTYSQLTAIAGGVAHMIQSQDVQVGDLVAVCFEKCPEASMAILGILMAGCTYVAIDPDAPNHRKHFILRDASCKFLLTSSLLSPCFLGIGEVTVIDISVNRLMKNMIAPATYRPRKVTGDNTCYCLYTSGTTGTPKGCLISHRSAVQAMHSFSRIFDGRWTRDSRWLQFAAYHFDVSVLEHFWSWKEGICVTVASRDLLFEDLPGMINRLKITHLDLTPSLARLLTPETVPSLLEGVFIVGGEQVRQDIIETWGGTGCLFNFYGPSEVTIGSTVHPHVEKNVKPTNIGWQWDNVGTYVLEPDSQTVVPVGAVGELCLSGVLVGQGYLNRPDLTARKFFKWDSTGDRVYRTGDLVRMLHNGSFDFLGRIDDQVKLRGQRLEIGEIDHVLLACKESFKDVATVVVKHPDQDRELLVTFLAQASNSNVKHAQPQIVSKDCSNEAVAKLRRHAFDRLPAYMVPTYFLIVDHLPLTMNNKANTKALKDLFTSMPLHEIRKQQETASLSQKAGPEEIDSLVQSVARHLGIDATAVDENSSLFQLGIDSISAIGLSRALKEVGFWGATIATIMRHPIIADLADLLSCKDHGQDFEAAKKEARDRIEEFAKKHSSTIETTLVTTGIDVEGLFPCTPLQQGMISRVVSSESASIPYFTKFIYQLDSVTDLPRLAKAWGILCDRLAILRTRFVLTKDGFAQVVLGKVKPTLSLDCDVGLTKDEVLKTIDQNFSAWSTTAKKLGRHCPWQVWLSQGENGGTKYMSLFIFHGLYDGISLPGLLERLWQLYNDSEAQVWYSQFFEALEHGPLIQRTDAADFWRRSLNHVRLLLDNQSSGGETSIGLVLVERTVPGTQIREMSKCFHVTPQATFLGAWFLALNKHFNTNPTIGIVVSGRSIDLENAENIIGPMFNTLPFAVGGLPSLSTFEDLIRRCHKLAADIIPFQHTSLSDIRKWLQISSGLQLFDTLFVFQSSRIGKIPSYTKHWKQVASDAVVDYPLNIEIEDSGKEFRLRVVAKPFVDAEALMNCFVGILENITQAKSVHLPDSFTEPCERVPQQSSSQHSGLPEKNDLVLSKDESVIRDEIAQLAKVDEAAIGAKHPTIFELGLDSVDALKLAARLQGRGMKVPVSKILQHPCVADIAQNCVENVTTSSISRPNQGDLNWRSIVEAQVANLDKCDAVLPVTPMQESLLLDYGKYYHVLVYELECGANIDRVIDAIHQSIQDLAILRTHFLMLEEPIDSFNFLQIVTKWQSQGETVRTRFQLRDEAELRKHLKWMKGHAELADSKAKTQISVLEDGRAYFILALPHALYDGWSLQLILDHIKLSYSAITHDTPGIDKIRESVGAIRQSATSQEATDFWTQQLRGACHTMIDAGSPSAKAHLIKKKSNTSLDRLHQACKKYGITLQSTCLATWTLAIMNLTKQVDVNFGIICSGRQTQEAERLAFPTFNTVVFRPQLNTRASKQKMLHEVLENFAQLYEHQHFPLSKARRLFDQGGELFNSLFTFQKTPANGSETLDLMKPVELLDDAISPPYPFNVAFEEENDDLMITLAVQAGYMTVPEIERVLKMLDHILSMLADPDCNEVFVLAKDQISIGGLQAFSLDLAGNPATKPSEPNQSDEGTDAKWSHVEINIRKAFVQVSGVREHEINKNTSLFNLGLDSISTIKVARVLQKDGWKIPVSTILRGQTVAGIAARIWEERRQAPTAKIHDSHQAAPIDLTQTLEQPLRSSGVHMDEVQHILPATGGQIYMLDMWRASRGRMFYATFWLEIRGCTKAKVQAAIKQLEAELLALRTRFIHHEDQIYQVVFKPDSEVPKAWSYQIHDDGGRSLVELHIHHALYDAVSLALTLRKLENLSNVATDQPILKTNIGTFVEMTRVKRDQARDFWQNYLSETLNTKFPAGAFEDERSEMFVPQLLPTTGLEAMGRREGISIQCLFFAAITRLYAHHRSSSVPTDTVVVGIYLANRFLDIDGISELAAPTFNVVPLKVDVSASSMLIDSARKIQKDLEEIGQMDRCGVSMREIHAWTGIKIDCYVNFLRLPEQETTSDPGRDDQVVTVRQCADAAKARRQTRVANEEDSVSPLIGPEGKEVNGLNEWCIPALDVEAKVDADKTFAVGMFAPNGMFDGRGLSRLMSELKETLQRLGA